MSLFLRYLRKTTSLGRDFLLHIGFLSILEFVVPFSPGLKTWKIHRFLWVVTLFVTSLFWCFVSHFLVFDFFGNVMKWISVWPCWWIVTFQLLQTSPICVFISPPKYGKFQPLFFVMYRRSFPLLDFLFIVLHSSLRLASSYCSSGLDNFKCPVF